MLVDLIDLFVDLSNTFGSLIDTLIVRIQNYKKIVSLSYELVGQDVSDVKKNLPEIDREISALGIQTGYVLITKIRSNDKKVSVSIVILDNHLKFKHYFRVLKQKSVFISGIKVPCYWLF